MIIRILRNSLLLGVTAGVLGFIIIMLSLVIWSRDEQPGDSFVPLPLTFDYYDWFDAGVADIDGDGNLDLFSSNHDARQSLLLGKGDGSFEDALSGLSFDHNPAFPGFEDSDAEMAFPRPGLYLYFRQGNLILRLVDAGSLAEKITGSLAISSAVNVLQQRGFEISVHTEKLSAEVNRSRVDFTAREPGSAELVIPYKAVPLTVQFADEVPLDNIFIGRQMSNPQQHQVTLYQRDRHGIAWSDINQDGRLDAFIVRGGLNGLINKFPDHIENEFLRSNAAQKFDRVTHELGLDQSACPARQVMWVDYDADGDLDLYMVCGRQTGGFWEYVPLALRHLSAEESGYPNRLYERTSDGKFKEVASQAGLDFPEGGYAAWLDVDQDGAMDLLWASEQGIYLYRNHLLSQQQSQSPQLPQYKGQFEAIKLSPSTDTQVRRFALSDFDADGDLDVFAIAAIGSRVLRNNDGTFESLDPSVFGLPEVMKTGSWLDYDNDGLTDFYAWPQGLFRQQPSGQFVETGVLAMSSPWVALMDARALWFDADNDGDLDALIMHRYYPHIIQESLPSLLPFSGVLYENRSTGGHHWLAVDLRGKPGNAQALGAKLLVRSSGKDSTGKGGGINAGQDVGHRQFQWVGQAEGSHYSQGHYRVYFGLGQSAEPVTLSLRWPDGHLQQQTVDVDQRLLLQREPDYQIVRQPGVK